MMNTPSNLLLTNMERLPGYEVVEVLGLVQGSTVRAKHAVRDMMAGLKNIVGGEIKGYTELYQQSRAEANGRMEEQALALGANAVLNIRYASASVAEGASEVLAYGTAVRVVPAATEPPPVPDGPSV